MHKEKMMRFSMLFCLAGTILLVLILAFTTGMKTTLCFGGGVLAGSLSALVSLGMIWHQAVQFAPADAQRSKRQGQSGYALRYLMYALILGGAAFLGASPLGMLVGVLLQKASLYAWAYLYGKEKI